MGRSLVASVRIVAGVVASVVIGVVGLVGVGACTDPEPALGSASAPATLNRDLDLLFVIDNSGSMAGEQASLAANFPTMIGVLQQLEGGLPNVHIGVVSSNVGAAGQASVPGCAGDGDNGNLLVKAGCSGLTQQFISDIANADGTRTKNYTGAMDTLFSCMAQLGTGGCGFEMHLESMFRALQPGKNPGFYRPGAYLAVVILGDEDDCSTEMGAMFGDPTAGLSSPLGPRTSFRCFEFGVRCANDPNPRAFGTKTGCVPDPSSQYMFEIDKYVSFLTSLKEDPSLVIVAAIVGDDDAMHTVVVGPDPTVPANPAVEKACFVVDPNDPNDGATPAIRTAAFARAFRLRNVVTTICSPSLSDAMIQIGELIRSTMADPGPLPAVDAGTDAPDPGDGDSPPGCCDAGTRAPTGPAVLALLAAALLLRRRPRRAR